MTAIKTCRCRVSELFVEQEANDIEMADAVPRKIGYVAGDDVFGVIIIDSFKIAELAFNRFGGSEKIADLHIDAFFALIGDEVDLIVVGFADFYVVSAGEEFEIDEVFIQLVKICFGARFNDVPEPQIDGIVFFTRGKQFFSFNVVSLHGVHNHRVFDVSDIGEDGIDRCTYPVRGEGGNNRARREWVCDVIHQEGKEQIQKSAVVQFITLKDVFDDDGIVSVRKVGLHRNFFEGKAQRQTAVTQIV